MTQTDRCVYCSYMIKLTKYRQPIPSPLAVEVIETPNGPRPLCAIHARYAVRVGEALVEGSIIPGPKAR